MKANLLNLNLNRAKKQLNSRDDIFLHHVSTIIKQNIGNDQFGVTDLSKKIRLCNSQINRRLNALIGYSARTLIRNIRMNHAALLLSHNTSTVGGIAGEVGYPNQANFSRSFKKHYGCSPKEYSKRHIFPNKINAHIASSPKNNILCR